MNIKNIIKKLQATDMASFLLKTWYAYKNRDLKTYTDSRDFVHIHNRHKTIYLKIHKSEINKTIMNLINKIKAKESTQDSSS